MRSSIACSSCPAARLAMRRNPARCLLCCRSPTLLSWRCCNTSHTQTLCPLHVSPHRLPTPAVQRSPTLRSWRGCTMACGPRWPACSSPCTATQTRWPRWHRCEFAANGLGFKLLKKISAATACSSPCTATPTRWPRWHRYGLQSQHGGRCPLRYRPGLACLSADRHGVRLL